MDIPKDPLSLLDPAWSSVGAPPAAACATRRGLGVGPLADVGRFRILGADRAKFLHGQCTQEVVSRQPGEGGAAFVLDARGQALSDLRFTIEDGYIACECARDRLDALLAWFEKYVITSDVRFERQDGRCSGWHVTGPGAAHALTAAFGRVPSAEDASVRATVAGHEVRIVGNRITGEVGFDVIVPADGLAAAADALRPHLSDAVALNPAALEILRVEAGRPLFGVDIDADVLPKETGQENRTVSYTKGCYAGQEVVAKQHFLGKPRKVLQGLKCDCCAQVGATVRVPGGAELGVVTSVAISPTLHCLVALAVLKGSGVAPGSRLEVVTEGSFVAATVQTLPFFGASPR